MKKTAIFIIIFALAILLCSCAGVTESALDYQIRPINMSGTLTLDGEDYRITFVSEEEGKAEILISEPSELEGVSFILDGGLSFVKYGDTVIELKDGSCAESGVLLTEKLFCIDKDTLTSVEMTEEYGKKLTKAVYRTDSTELTVFSEQNRRIPVRFEFKTSTSELQFCPVE